MSFLKWMLSFLVPVTLRSFESSLSGKLYICLENGKKVLNTDRVNYSYNSLHRVFKNAFIKGRLNISGMSNALLLGLGGGSVVHILRNDLKYTENIDCVELDPVIIHIAQQEFSIHTYSPIHLIQEDACRYMTDSPGQYDLICVDIFINETVPAEFTRQPFITALLNSCSPGGIIFFNTMDNRTSGLLKTEITRVQPDIRIEVLQIEETNHVIVIRK